MLYIHLICFLNSYLNPSGGSIAASTPTAAPGGRQMKETINNEPFCEI